MLEVLQAERSPPPTAPPGSGSGDLDGTTRPGASQGHRSADRAPCSAPSSRPPLQAGAARAPAAGQGTGTGKGGVGRVPRSAPQSPRQAASRTRRRASSRPIPPRRPRARSRAVAQLPAPAPPRGPRRPEPGQGAPPSPAQGPGGGGERERKRERRDRERALSNLQLLLPVTAAEGTGLFLREWRSQRRLVWGRGLRGTRPACRSAKGSRVLLRRGGRLNDLAGPGFFPGITEATGSPDPGAHRWRSGGFFALSPPRPSQCVMHL